MPAVVLASSRKRRQPRRPKERGKQRQGKTQKNPIRKEKEERNNMEIMISG
jgi:hypothetical protein